MELGGDQGRAAARRGASGIEPTANVTQVRDPDAVSDPRALTGAMIGGGFGIAWGLWGASGLRSQATADVRMAAIVIGLVILVGSVLTQRHARSAGRGVQPIDAVDDSGSLFSSVAYRWVVLVEVIALIAGGAVLGATGHSEYTIAWFAGVVGSHFLFFGRLFWTGFYWLGGAMLAGALAGALVGLAGAGSGAIRAVSGLTAAASLFSAGGLTLVMAVAARGAPRS